MPTKTTPRRMALYAVAGIALIAVLGLTLTATTDVVCSSCHVMRIYSDGLAEAQHATIDCHSCHSSTPEARISLTSNVVTKMIPATLFGADDVSGPGTRIPGGACLSCHAEVMNTVTDTRGIRIDHASCVSETGACDACHTTATHGEAARWPRQIVMEECTICHVENGASIECDICHQGKLQSERLARGPWRVTHGPEWQTTHGAGTLDACRTCHPPNYCTDCHGLELPHPASFGLVHGTAAIGLKDTCEDCHDRQDFCDACHGAKMPHPASFLPDHPEIADGYEDEGCLSCHRQVDCDNCHILHTHPGNTRGTLGGDSQ